MVADERRFKDAYGYYDFFATPDGQECLPKTYYYTKYGAISGAVFSIYEVVLLSKPTTWQSTVARIGHFTLPSAGMGFAFGCSLCLLAQIRKKDDPWNHGLAGIIAGGVWGLKYNRISVGHWMAGLVGFTAAYFKFFHHYGYTIMAVSKAEKERHYPQLDFHIKMYDDPGRPKLP